MPAYYNEFDPYAAQWLRNLIAAGHIAPGDVDERSIVDVQPDDLTAYSQCHFFAGIGGWSLAARLAGWDDTRELWTGSCPCQPFSVAGNQKGFSDPRHLWPEFSRLIKERCPPVVFGEQVASAADWLAHVRSDMEALGYAVGAIPMEAASAGADHLRDRFWFVADHDFQRTGSEWAERGGEFSGSGSHKETHVRPIPDLPGERGNRGKGATRQAGRFGVESLHLAGGEYIEFADGKWRNVPPPGVRWMGAGVPARVAKLRAIGNAIDPRPASQFIAAYMDCQP